MKDENICEIIEDILPLYVDNLTSEVTNVFVERHFEECTKCQEAFQLMNNPISSVPLKNRRIRYKKKFNWILTLGVISILVILAFVGVIAYIFLKNI
jgi:hypothetical protein